MRRPVRIGRPLVERIVVPSRLELPVKRGQVVGELRVYDRKRVVGQTPLVAAESREEPGFVDRSGWYAGRAVDHVGGWFS
jgi:D-alanyl-D-alanine carboxypeptidase